MSRCSSELPFGTGQRQRDHARCVAVDDLSALLRKHMAAPFPVSVTKGIDYGSVDPVMIGADIYGWASRIEQGEVLTSDDRSELASARNDLAASIDEFPPDARGYYEVVLDIADAALR